MPPARPTRRTTAGPEPTDATGCPGSRARSPRSTPPTGRSIRPRPPATRPPPPSGPRPRAGPGAWSAQDTPAARPGSYRARRRSRRRGCPGRAPGGDACSRRLEEPAHPAQEGGELVVVDPVSRPLDGHDVRVAEGGGVPLRFRVGRPRLAAAHEQHRAGDVAPDLARLVDVEQVGRDGAYEVVELPRVGAVLVPDDAAHREMP